MSMSRAIVSFLQGSYWLRYQSESKRIPAEHCTSHSRLTTWVESQLLRGRGVETEVFYNFDSDLLPAEEVQSSIAPAPSRAVKLVTVLSVRAPRVMMAEQMAMRKEQGLSTEGKAMSPRVTLVCAYKECGKEFERRASLLAYKQNKEKSKGHTSYCSKQCSSRAAQSKKPESIELVCEHCKQKFMRPRRNINKGGKIAFCSAEHKSQHYRQTARHNARREEKPNAGT